MKKWYVARSKPRNEELLWKQLCLRGLESYYPCIKAPTSNLHSRMAKPYFPGYLFVRVDLDLISRSTLEWIPGGVGLVSFGNEPAFVHDGVLHAIKHQIESLKMVSGNIVTPLCKGDHVIVDTGIFAGHKGIFDTRLSGSDRVRILLSFLNDGLLPVEMPAGYIHTVNQN